MHKNIEQRLKDRNVFYFKKGGNIFVDNFIDNSFLNVFFDNFLIGNGKQLWKSHALDVFLKGFCQLFFIEGGRMKSKALEIEEFLEGKQLNLKLKNSPRQGLFQLFFNE